MNGRKRPEPPDGSAWSPAWGPVALALGLLAGGLAWWWSTQPNDAGPAPAEAVAASAPRAPANPAAAQPRTARNDASPAMPPNAASPALPLPPAPRIARGRDPNGDQSPDLSDYVNEGEMPTMAEVIERLHRAGVHSGLGAFNPPGTRPPLIGLAVPEDYPLPPGYVRHHQATDDGQRIEAILMYSPDQPALDAAGQPIPPTPDRVVPAELAPAGLPIRRVVVPAPVDAGRPGR